MATHHLQHAPSAQHVIVMDAGRILAQGPPDHVPSVWPALDRAWHPEDSKIIPGTADGVDKAKRRWNMLRLVNRSMFQNWYFN
jgi:energy-coupling factor transporter ATP-binding protein EcfA2